MTGRYAFRTGVSQIRVTELVQPGLRLSETTLPEILPDTWTTAILGKWHLGNGGQGLEHAVNSGFDYFAGSRFNIPGYYNWPKTVAMRTRTGVVATEGMASRYATLDTTDDALFLVRNLSEPWFVIASYHAAHAPFQPPPEQLHSYGEFPENVKINETTNFMGEEEDDEIEFDDVESSEEENDLGVGGIDDI